MKEWVVRNRHYILTFLILIMMISSTIYLSEFKESDNINEQYKENSIKKSSTTTSSGSSSSSGSSPSRDSKPQRITYEPLTEEENQKVTDLILSSEMVAEIPEKNPISIQFFHFNYGYRTWQNKYIMADGQIIKSGKPVIKLTLHSKYLPEFDTKDFCTVIQEANKNRDLGFDSQESKTSLLWKYKGMMEHRACLGV